MTPTSAVTDVEEGPGAASNLSRAAVGGVKWQGLSYLLGKLLVLISTVALARLLTPRDFGVVGLALIFVTYVEGITDLGAAEALVYLPADRRSNDAAFTLSLVWSGMLTVTSLLAAPLVAGFLHRPDITTMFRVLSFALLIRGTAEVPDALLRKNLRFRQRLIADLARVLAQGALSISLALAGLGPWAIVYGYLAANVAWSVVAWTLVGYRPGPGAWHPRWIRVRPLLAFGIPAAANVLILSLVFDVDYLIVGRRLGAQALGFYTLGFRLPELVIINVFFVLSTVAFPLYTRARGDMNRFRSGYLTAIRLQSVYGITAGLGLAVLAPMVIHVLFGPRWEAAIVPLQALALYAAFRSLGVGPIDAYKAMGRPGLAVALSIVRLAVLLPVLLFAVRFGIQGVAWAQAGVAFALAVLMQAVAGKVIGVPARRLMAAFVPAAAAGMGVVLGAGAARLLVPGPESVGLATGVIAGLLAGLAGLRAADRNFVRRVRSMLRPGTPSASEAAP